MDSFGKRMKLGRTDTSISRKWRLYPEWQKSDDKIVFYNQCPQKNTRNIKISFQCFQLNKVAFENRTFPGIVQAAFAQKMNLDIYL
jgi:hypothetical protein